MEEEYHFFANFVNKAQSKTPAPIKVKAASKLSEIGQPGKRLLFGKEVEWKNVRPKQLFCVPPTDGS